MRIHHFYSSWFFGALIWVFPVSLMPLSSISPVTPDPFEKIPSNSKSTMLSCTQSDLIICNYGSILSFVDALITELNNQLNNCGGSLVNCNQSSCCYNTADFTFTTQLSSGKNPYFYCTTESCNSFTCGLTGGGSQHNDLSIADQNEILSIMRTAAGAAAGCGEGNSKAINNYRVYRSGNPNESCSSSGTCFNISIKLEVKYLCSCQN